MMRGFLGVLFCALWGACVLGGCGQVPDAVPVRVVAETANFRTVEHTFGMTDVPVDPQRIIALGEEAVLADLIDGGYAPVMSIVNSLDSVPLLTAEELDGVDLFTSASRISAEMLLAYEPDLIIVNIFFVNDAGYERLSEIAPTVAVNSADPLTGFLETWTVLGQAEAASTAVAVFREALAEARGEIAAIDTTVTVSAVYAGSNLAIWFDGPQPQPQMLNVLGVNFYPPEGERDDLGIRNGRSFINEERLDLLGGEQMIMLQSEVLEGESEALAELLSDPLWQQIPAVQNGRVSVLDRLGYPGFRGQQTLLKDLLGILLE